MYIYRDKTFRVSYTKMTSLPALRTEGINRNLMKILRSQDLINSLFVEGTQIDSHITNYNEDVFYILQRPIKLGMTVLAQYPGTVDFYKGILINSFSNTGKEQITPILFAVYNITYIYYL